LKIQNSSTNIRDELFFSFFQKHVGITSGQEESYFTCSFSTSIGPGKIKKNKGILTIIWFQHFIYLHHLKMPWQNLKLMARGGGAAALQSRISTQTKHKTNSFRNTKRINERGPCIKIIWKIIRIRRISVDKREGWIEKGLPQSP